MQLANTEEFAEGTAKGFTIPGGSLLVVNWQGRFHVYVNCCPHLGVNLDWQQDKFFNYDQSHLQCSMHGALFTVESGLCVAGPCRNQSLKAIDFDIIDGAITLQRNPFE